MFTGGAGTGTKETPYLVVVRRSADGRLFGNLYRGRFLAADEVPGDRAAHGGDEDFSGFRLVGKRKA